MRVALVNPPWTFEGSIYFGCREPHLPLEYGYAKALLEAAGHQVVVVDAQLGGLGLDDVRCVLEGYEPELTVVTTAPSYLFWRCAPPELRVPKLLVAAIRDVAGVLAVVGPHASTTPHTTLRKLDVDVAVVGECEEVLVRLASTPRAHWPSLESVVLPSSHSEAPAPAHAECDMKALPPLRWDADFVARHAHHHHRFDRPPGGTGAEVEASRGCPYHCTFCAKDNFRNGFRRRPLQVVLDEIDALVAQGVEYVYFVDEIFLPWHELLESLCRRDVEIGAQLRIDNWDEASLELLGRAGCVSIEAGVESITPQGRSLLAKNCRKSTDELTRLLLHAKKHVPFVQANLIEAKTDRPDDVARWRENLQTHGVWSNEPVPMFPYPGSPDYTLRWGPPDDKAWERAHEYYLAQFRSFSDIQESRPQPLPRLEACSAAE